MLSIQTDTTEVNGCGAEKKEEEEEVLHSVERSGDLIENIILELQILFPIAVLGGKIEIPTLDGKVGLKIPKGIHSGQILRMKGKGFPKIRSRYYGDQLVKIQINTPKTLSRQTKGLIKDLQNNLDPIKKPFRKIEL